MDFDINTLRQLLEEDVDTTSIPDNDIVQGVQEIQQSNPQADVPTIKQNMVDFVSQQKPELLKRRMAPQPNPTELFDLAQERAKQRIKKGRISDTAGMVGDLLKGQDPTKDIKARHGQIQDEEKGLMEAHLRQKMGDPTLAESQYKFAEGIEQQAAQGKATAASRDPNSPESLRAQDMVRQLKINFDPTGLSEEQIHRALPHGVKLHLEEMKNRGRQISGDSRERAVEKFNDKIGGERESLRLHSMEKSYNAARKLKENFPVLDQMFQLSKRVKTGPIVGHDYMVKARVLLGDKNAALLKNITNASWIAEIMKFASEAGVRAIDTKAEQERLLSALANTSLPNEVYQAVVLRIKSLGVLANHQADAYDEFMDQQGARPTQFKRNYVEPIAYVNLETGDIKLVPPGEKAPDGYLEPKNFIFDHVPELDEAEADVQPKKYVNDKTGQDLMIRDGKWVPYKSVTGK